MLIGRWACLLRDGAVVRSDGERNVDGNLFDVGTLADVDDVAGRRGVYGVLNSGEGSSGAIDFAVANQEGFGEGGGTGKRCREKSKQDRTNERTRLHGFPLIKIAAHDGSKTVWAERFARRDTRRVQGTGRGSGDRGECSKREGKRQ